MMISTSKGEMKASLIRYLKINYRNFLETMLSYEDFILLQKLDSDIPAKNAMLAEARALIFEVIDEL